MPIDLPTLYPRVVAVNPKAAVPLLRRWEVTGRPHWYMDNLAGMEHRRITNDEANALVGWHWLGLACKSTPLDGFVVRNIDTLIPALAEHLAPGSTKEGT